MRSISRVLLCSSVGLLAVAGCHDAIAPYNDGMTPPPGLTLKLDPFVTTGLTSPVFLTQPLNDARIFVVEKAGRIRVVTNGALQTMPFLDISAKVQSTSTEQGLFSVAFHPQYAANHFFYVYYTTHANGTQADGDIVIERYTTSTDPEVATPATAKLIITAAHSTAANHNGGLVSFGPDGMLYAGFGDGGGGGDPAGNGQNSNALLGSLLRLDVNGGDPYAIPASNGLVNKRGEVWAKGLRNPWRYTFDAPTGLLYVADVGQNAREEVSVVPASQAGLNYGWNIMEGFSCYGAIACNRTGLTLPVIDYVNPTEGCSVTGGYVYRGSAIPGIVGHYFYSDYCSKFLRSFRYSNGVAVDRIDWGLTAPGFVASFGVDFAGELYLLSGNSVLKLAAGS